MVCIEETHNQKIKIKVLDNTPNSTQKKYSILVRSSYKIRELINDISTQYQYKNFDLFLQTSGESPKNTLLNDHRERTVSDFGITFDKNNVLIIKEPQPKKEPPVSTKTEEETNNHCNNHNSITHTIELKKQVKKVKNNINGKMADGDADTEMLTDKSIVIETGNGSDDDFELALGASASPTEQISSCTYPPAPPAPPAALFDVPIPIASASEDVSTSQKFNMSTLRRVNDFQPIQFNGLVNQAMTCYLNSLLQALFMTPEFRNALYDWEFDRDGSESKSIPYQLQKLFLRLQTNKGAVETTELTKSFGWDSSEAWQQHDIQELCRVMFDALEQKFKKTKHSNLINQLYEGKMIDYVKCLECSTEKSREDKFLDIPLPLRQFGSTTAYESVEEALKAFVLPEILDGNNQYFCERCNKKCDAHKGLKFSRFPYILTLHLKRFDFDYQTFHRIKLNDRVTFPQSLNLNTFVNNNFEQQVKNQNHTSETNSLGQESVESAIKFDDCSTTDSGSALEEDGTQFNHQNNCLTEESQEDDEGMDMSVNGDCKSLMSNSTSTDSSSNGPFIYDLFAIMIHSGSASGGHYYAYIRDFETNKWYSFNDQTVSTITQEDIAKSFGGNSFKGYYSGVYSSSTNAYMLMYRQNDSRRNCLAMKSEQFPPHIQELLKRINDKDEVDRRSRDTDMLKLKVFYKNRKTQVTSDTKVFITADAPLKEALETAYYRLQVKVGVPMSNCRLVGYDSASDNIDCSFEDKDDEKIGELMDNLRNNKELLLETKGDDEEWEVYKSGGVMTKVFAINLTNLDIEGPIDVRGIENDVLMDYKTQIAKKLDVNSENLLVAVKQPHEPVRILQNDLARLREENFEVGIKVFVGIANDNGELSMLKFKKCLERFEHLITLYFLLPNNKKETLETMSIPSYDPLVILPRSGTPTSTSCDQVDAMAFDNDTFNNNCNYPNNNFSNHNLNNNVKKVLPSSECNSEDSSLSDSDRTLVESGLDDLSMMSTNNSPVNSSPDEMFFNLAKNYFKANYLSDDGNKNSNSGSIDSGNENENDDDATTSTGVTSSTDINQKVLKVLTDKDLSLASLKEYLQPYVKVPMEYFKIFKMSDTQTESECTKLTDTLTNTFKDGERVTIELGRALRAGEYKAKLYFLNLSEINDDTEKIPFVCEYILRNGAEVGQTKREILAHIIQLDKKYERLTFDGCRLRKKNWKSPTKLFLDDQKFGDDIILLSTNTSNEIILQEIAERPANVDDDGELINDFTTALFVRRFYPSKMDMGPYEEIVVGRHGEIKKLLSKLSGIPEENVAYAKLNGSFPRYSHSVMQMQGLNWFAHTATIEDSPLQTAQDGSIFIYKDNTEPLKELTLDEKSEISRKENVRFGTTPTTSTYSPRRERALKIYLDSPKKREE